MKSRYVHRRSLLEIREEIPRGLLYQWTTIKEYREKTSQDIARRRGEILARILVPQESRKPYGKSKSPKKPARRERTKITTCQQKWRLPRRSGGKKNIISLCRNCQWEKIRQKFPEHFGTPYKNGRDIKKLRWSSRIERSPQAIVLIAHGKRSHRNQTPKVLRYNF